MDDVETVQKYKSIIMDKYKVKDHDNIIKLMKSDEFVSVKLATLQSNGIDVKLMTNPYHKVKLAKSIEREYGLDFLAEAGANKADMTSNLYTLIKHTFRLRKAKPTTI